MSFCRLQQRLAFCCLALALVLAPALGRMHQVLHAPLFVGVASDEQAILAPAMPTSHYRPCKARSW